MSQKIYDSPESEQALRRKRLSEGSQKRMAEEFKSFTIESIVGSMCSESRIEWIKPRIHKIELFGADHSRGAYNFNQVRSQFKNVLFHPHRGELYKDFYPITLKGFEEIYIERGLREGKNGNPCNIVIVPEDSLSTESYRDLLTHFDKALPDLKPSIVEYTLDLFPTIYFGPGEDPIRTSIPDKNKIRDESDVTMIFHLLRKYIFVKWIKETWTEFSDVSLNWTTYFGKKRREGGKDSKEEDRERIQKQLTIYTRGKKKDSKEHDRVRIELRIYRDLLRKRGILTLEDMIRDVKFSETWKGVINFMHFKSPHMPEDHEYLTKDKVHGYSDAFQLEYLEMKKSHKDMTKYIESLKELDPFKERLSKVAKEFDREWKWPEYSRVFPKYDEA
jgi:hypothetical protein